ncbi:hypothetical protein CW748_04410 [Alteromonadales bacterium alter-6D02]|nr:hypothetical protein CW748_04410 [Alteromonadales bacterium alter-6D02]
MFRVIFSFVIIILIFGCSDSTQQLTPKMEKMATQTVIKYLERNDLPNENLVVSISKNRAIADFSFMYTGSGRCINFIVKCYGNDCTSLQKYPYDEHGEKCP